MMLIPIKRRKLRTAKDAKNAKAANVKAAVCQSRSTSRSARCAAKYPHIP